MGETLKSWLKALAVFLAVIIGLTFIAGGPKEAAGLAVDIIGVGKEIGQSFMIFVNELRANV